MSNGMPSWDEWSGLSAEQREYSLFKVLSDLYSRECHRDETCDRRLALCTDNFAKQTADILLLKERKRFDTSIATVAGLVGGALVWVIKWIAVR